MPKSEIELMPDEEQTGLFAPSVPGTSPAFDLKPTFKAIRNYLAGRAVGATRDEALMDELVKCLYAKIYVERHPDALPEGFDPQREDESRLAAYCQELLRAVRKAHPSLLGNLGAFSLDAEALVYTMRALFRVPLLDASRDVVGDVFEAFVGSHIRGQDGQFFTPKNAIDFLVEAVDPQVGEMVLDPACGAGGFLSSTVQHLVRGGASEHEVRAFSSSRLFGIDKDEYLAELARTHLALLTESVPHVACADSLAWRCQLPGSLDDYPVAGEYDVVLTNPPFGSRIVAATGAVLLSYELARKWRRTKAEAVPTKEFQRQVPPQVLFVERCIQLVKPGGRLGIVVPESLVSSEKHRYVVEHLRRQCTIELVAGMPEDLFKSSGKGGTHTKTCLLVLQRRKGAAPGHFIFMAEAQWCGHDSRGKVIPHDDLPHIVQSFRQWKSGSQAPDTLLGFVIEDASIRDNVLAPRHYEPSVQAELSRLEATHSLITFGRLVEDGIVEVSTGDEVGKLAYGTGPVPFVRTSDLSHWEIKVDSKQGVSEEIYKQLRPKQDVRPNDILMVRDGTYLIGTCAIVTPQDLPMVYQSHIYKIRVKPNDQALTPSLLIAMLGSSIVQRQVKAKRVTQDIIDSLGSRINDLVLPLPKSLERRQEISALVQRAIEARMEARALSRRALQSVVDG